MSDPFDNPEAPPASPFVPPSFGPPTEPVYAPTQQTPAYGLPGNPAGASVVLASVQRPPRRSRAKMLGAVAGVVAVLGAATFAVAQLRSNDTNGGAASPKELGDKLVAAFTSEDVLGAIDLLVPGERETFRQPMIDLVHELTRLEVADKSADLNKIGGVDISISNQKVTVAQTNVSDIARVTITGRSKIVVDGKAVPIGNFLVDQAFNGERANLDANKDDAKFDLSFASVERDGRWYVSLFYSAADKLRSGKDIPEKGVTPAGAATPEGAVDDMLTAIEKLDIEKMIAGLNPNEAEALQRYAPLFIADAQRQLDDFAGRITITSPKYSVTGSGNTRQVSLTAVKFTADSNAKQIDFEIKNGCVTMSTADTKFDSCDAKGLDKTVDKYLDQQGITDTAPLHTFIKDARKAFSDFEMHGLVVDNVNGKWFVSPIGSFTELLLSTLRALDRNEIETLVKDGRDVIGGVFGGISAGSDSTSSTGSRSTSGGSDWYSCLSGASDPQGCIHDGVANGTLDRQYIPVPFLYPDCGLFGYYNGDGHYSDAPDVFLKTIEPARRCLLDAAKADGIDVSLLTPELLYPECFKNVNPSDYSDEAAYGAAYDCVSANG